MLGTNRDCKLPMENFKKLGKKPDMRTPKSKVQKKEEKEKNTEWLSFISQPRKFIVRLTSMTFLFGYATPLVLLTIVMFLAVNRGQFDPTEIYSTFAWGVLVLSGIWTTYKYFDKINFRSYIDRWGRSNSYGNGDRDFFGDES